MRSELNHAWITVLCPWGPVPPERRKCRKAVVSFPAAPGSFEKSLLTSCFFFFFFLILFFFHILSHWFITGSSTQSRVLYSRTLLFIHSKCNVFASLNPKLSPPLSHPPRVMFLCAFSDLPPPPAGVRFSSFFLAAWTEKV